MFSLMMTSSKLPAIAASLRFLDFVDEPPNLSVERNTFVLGRVRVTAARNRLDGSAGLAPRHRLEQGVRHFAPARFETFAVFVAAWLRRAGVSERWSG